MAGLRAARAAVVVDDRSRADRISATIRIIVRFAPLNLVTAAAMCGAYAWRFAEPLILLAGLPVILVVGASLALFRGRFVRQWQLAPETAAGLMNHYALAIGFAWFVLLGALNTVPLTEDRIGISCVNVAVICLGGTIFTLVPGAALIFMAVVGMRLAIDLGAIVGVPVLYVAAIAAFVIALAGMAIGQARLFAERMAAAEELATLERRRADEAQRAANAQRAQEREHERRRAAEHQAAAEEQRAIMNDHAQRFDSSVAAAIDILSGAASELTRSTAQLAEMGVASGSHVAAVRGRALAVAQSMADVQRAADDLRRAIGAIAVEVTGQVEATANAEAASTVARAQARALAESSALVRGITAKIENIARRTNTLALNALIEATQSGAAGAGFAVVAGEVKALAAQTRTAALEIGHHIADMDANASDVAASVDRIAGDVGRIALGASDIARAIDNQRASTDGILAGVDGARDGAQTVQIDLQALADKAESAVGLAHQIERVANDIGVQSANLGTASAAFGARLRHN